MSRLQQEKSVSILLNNHFLDCASAASSTLLLGLDLYNFLSPKQKIQLVLEKMLVFVKEKYNVYKRYSSKNVFKIGIVSLK